MPQLSPVQESEPLPNGIVRAIQNHRDLVSQCTELESKSNVSVIVAAFWQVNTQPGVKNIKLTERHLVEEAELTLHHLGPSQFRRWVNSDPVETICPHGVTVKSWVIGGWSLNSEKCTQKNPQLLRALTNGEILWWLIMNANKPLEYHKHISSGDVFVHHKPGIPLSSYPRPLAQCQSEPAWMNRNVRKGTQIYETIHTE